MKYFSTEWVFNNQLYNYEHDADHQSLIIKSIKRYHMQKQSPEYEFLVLRWNHSKICEQINRFLDEH